MPGNLPTLQPPELLRDVMISQRFLRIMWIATIPIFLHIDTLLDQLMLERDEDFYHFRARVVAADTTEWISAFLQVPSNDPLTRGGLRLA